MKNPIKKVCMAAVAGAMILSSSATVLANTGVAGGYVVVDEYATITKTYVTSSNILSRNQVVSGSLTGTWFHGNQNTNWLGQGGQVFSAVTGSSLNNASRARGLGTAVNGNGVSHTVGWRAPGVQSRGEIDRTSGTNRALWNLDTP